jgi:hypothetical protein
MPNLAISACLSFDDGDASVAGMKRGAIGLGGKRRMPSMIPVFGDRTLAPRAKQVF